MSIKIKTEQVFRVSVYNNENTYDEFEVYSGDCEDKAEEFEASLEMCREIVEAVALSQTCTVRQIQSVWEVLETNGHTPYDM